MQEFDQLVGQGNIVVADFYADWCGPCQELIPTLNDVSEKFEGRVDIVKVNVDDLHELATRFGIRTIPTIVYFHNQKVVDKTEGVQTKAELERRIVDMEGNKK